MASRALRWRRARRRLMFLLIHGLMRVIGFDSARRLGAVIGALHYRLVWRPRQRCASDIAQVLGRTPDDPLTARQLRRAYRVSTVAVLEILAMLCRRVDERRLAARCEIEGLDHLHAALARGRGAILLGTHMGNGVLFAIRLAGLGLPVSVVYKRSRMMSDELFDQGLARYGVDGIPANQSIRAWGRMLRALKQNRIVYLIMDQGVKPSQNGVVLRFLGKDLPMPAGPAQLARHAGSPVLPIATIAADPAWRFRIETPLAQAAGATLEQELQALLRATERQILQHPELWSWHHRRWRFYPLASTAPD